MPSDDLKHFTDRVCAVLLGHGQTSRQYITGVIDGAPSREPDLVFVPGVDSRPIVVVEFKLPDKDCLTYLDIIQTLRYRELLQSANPDRDIILAIATDVGLSQAAEAERLEKGLHLLIIDWTSPERFAKAVRGLTTNYGKWQ